MNPILRYGKSSVELHIDDSVVDVQLLAVQRTPPGTDEALLIRSALAEPLDSPPLSQIVSSRQRVVVVTSDVTRPCPSARLLPPVLNELRRGGIGDQDITVVLGRGSHRPHTTEERVQLVGEEVYRRVRCIDSDPADVELIGRTSRGTPIAVFRPVLEADVRVCLGAIEYHYFVGYSGGYKAIVPGVCGIDTIQTNHRMLTAPGAVAGKREGNPAREDIDEAGERVGVDFIVNVIQDESKRVVSAVAGHPRTAHQEGCRRLDAFGRVTVDQSVDIVIVSAGGHPKDINLYQAQKALDNARHIVRPGGVILLIAECGEGLGHPTFESWMKECDGPDAILSRIQQEFVLGGHKAAAVAMAMKQADIYMVSTLAPDFTRSIGLFPFDDPDQALRSALQCAGTPTRLAVIPQGGAVLATLAD